MTTKLKNNAKKRHEDMVVESQDEDLRALAPNDDNRWSERRITNASRCILGLRRSISQLNAVLNRQDASISVLIDNIPVQDMDTELRRSLHYALAKHFVGRVKYWQTWCGQYLPEIPEDIRMATRVLLEHYEAMCEG